MLVRFEFSAQQRGIWLPRVNQGREVGRGDGKGVGGGRKLDRHNGPGSFVWWYDQREFPGDWIAKITFQNISEM